MLLLSYLKRFFAGAVFGLYMAYLLYFLNPQLEVTPLTIAVAVVVYATICGVLFGSALWLLRVVRVRVFGRGENAATRHGFGAAVGSVALCAALYWAHLALLRIYLPRGAVRILSKATVLIAATAFLLFILWLIERNASRAASRAILLAASVLVLISALLLYQRREGYRTSEEEVGRTELSSVAAPRPLIVVAIRNLPYDWLLTIIGEESLPNIQMMHSSGFASRIEPFRTTSQKAIWASLATGQLPNRHGVTGRFSYRTLLNRENERFSLVPSAVGFRAWGLIPPVERISAQLPAGESIPFWRFFENVGVDSVVVNWPGTDRAEGGAAALVSDRDIRHGARRDEKHAARIARLRSTTTIPAAVEARISALPVRLRGEVRARMAEDVIATRVALELRSESAARVTVVTLNGLADAAERLQIRGNDVPERGSRNGDAVRAHLALLDTLLGEIRDSDADATIVIVSPCAIVPPSLPVSVAGLLQLAGDLDDPGRNDGFVVFSGKHFVQRANPAAGEVIDIVPSLLYAAALPLARDLDGKILTEAFDEIHLRETPMSMIPSYRNVSIGGR